jgi:tRNA pseudouridine38-40 synthase
MLVEYDGGAFNGLQKQNHTANTVQAHIEHAVRTLGSSDPNFAAAGRTDAGVHALGQVVAVDVPSRLAERRLALALNAVLPPAIRIRRAVHCAADFHPRLDARMRTYVYRIASRDPVPPMFRVFVAQTLDKLDPEKTRAAARLFQGRREFRQWRSSECQGRRTVLTIEEVTVHAPGEGPIGEDLGGCQYWRFLVRARSFLHHQVRFMAGALTAVGGGRLTLEELQEALSRGERPGAVRCEPACGLCFTRVEYPGDKDPFTVGLSGQSPPGGASDA